VEIPDLDYLVASASAGNFGRATESLGLNTSTIGRRIGRLEDELGLALFERGHSGVWLTPAGKAVMLNVRRVFTELDAVRHLGTWNGSGDVGEIQLGVRLSPIGQPVASLVSSPCHPESAAENPKLLIPVNTWGPIGWQTFGTFGLGGGPSRAPAGC
jgi:DNA-binding transcriptional LysR family regulator